MKIRSALWLTFCAVPSFLSAQTLADIRNQGKEIVQFAYPMVESQARAAHAAAAGVPWNQLKFFDPKALEKSEPLLFTATDYASAISLLDLRNEPVVISLPKTDSKTPISVQITDWQGYLVANLGTLNQGAGNFVIAASDWDESLPPTATELYRLNSSLGFLQIRFQSSPAVAAKLMSEIKMQKFSVFAARKTVKTYGPLSLKSVNLNTLKDQNLLNALSENLIYASSKDKDLVSKAAKLGLVAGKAASPTALAGDLQKSLLAVANESVTEILNAPKTSEIPAPLFGSKDDFKGDLLKKDRTYSWTGLVHAKNYALELPVHTDGEGRALDGFGKRYTLKIKADQLNSLSSDWSLTFYDYDKKIVKSDKYVGVLRKADLAKFAKDSKGDLTLYIQADQPVPDLMSNWIAIPEGRFSAIFRVYQAPENVLNGSWTLPGLRSFPR